MNKHRKNITQYVIQRSKFHDTKPELFVQEILEELGVRYQKQFPVSYYKWRFRIDFLANGKAIECQGPIHDTPIQRRKAAWRYHMIWNAGYPSILVPSSLCAPGWKEYLKARLANALFVSNSILQVIPA